MSSRVRYPRTASPLPGRAAFSLVEILVVVLILAVLAIIAIPRLTGSSNKSKDASALSRVRNALTAARSFYQVNSESYKGFNATQLSLLESAFSSTDLDTQLAACSAPGSCANQNDRGRMVFIGNGIDGTDPQSSPGDPNDGTRLVICAMSTGINTFCARDDGQTTRYAVYQGAFSASTPLWANITLTQWINTPVGPPTNSALPTITTAAPTVSALVNSSPGTWSDSPTSYLYQWRQCDSAGSNCVDINTNGTSASYTPGAGDVGKTLRLVVRAVNSNGTSSPATSSQSNAVVAAPAAPVSTGAPVLSNYAPDDLSTITTTDGTWSGSPTSYAYMWFRCTDQNNPVAGSNCIAASDNTTYQTSSYTANTTDDGKYLRARVGATNAVGTTYAWSPATNAVTVWACNCGST